LVLLLGSRICSSGDHRFSTQSDDQLQAGFLQSVHEHSVTESQCMSQTAQFIFFPIYCQHITIRRHIN